MAPSKTYSDNSKRPTPEAISIVGASVAGTWQALAFAQAGCPVTLYERHSGDLVGATSYWAGGMLAPDCEAEVSEPLVARLGHRSLALWRDALPGTRFEGSLVVAHTRDRADFERFARLTPGHARLDAAGVAALEPALAGRFRDGLFYAAEGHVEPRRVLPMLYRRLAELGVVLRFGEEVAPHELPGTVIDCRGLAAQDALPELRGVKGEVVIVESRDVTFTRPVRLLHPRWPLYVIPREDGRFLIGATSIESEDDRVSVRSALELMTAAYALHPAFGEARIVEIGAGLRPAFPDHAPRVTVEGRILRVNGLYRHGFLLAPALAELTAAFVVDGQQDDEVIHAGAPAHRRAPEEVLS
ncbi:FAD-dependent oxidoreductase [Chelatococcus reniformis]|uniref:D-amino-acid oxidase n=1 Tax=Chelatococcus reniformis TaxID=1494448 RepID=A0A916UC06_9HYPH|nr:FAD-dependent oxidoreductase [Chelatococcus reniformis]GGC67047.1 glycine oxidase [Chelatococcus reniformis]